MPVGLSSPDLFEWDYWWEFNKDAYLVRKSPPASLEEVQEVVVPALVRGLEEANAPEIRSSCLIALARIGQVLGLEEILKGYRAHPVQMISETAVIASGIAASEKALPDLLEILKAIPRGAESVGDAPRLDYRKQAFAGYALGLIAGASQEVALKRTVYEAAKGVLEGPGRFAEHDLLVAAINAMRLLDLDSAHPEHAKLAVEASRYLLDYLKDEEKPFQARAQVPPAVARLLGRAPGHPPKGIEPDDLAKSPGDQTGPLRSAAIRLFCRILRTKGTNNKVVQSCVLGLGQIAHNSDQEVLRILYQTASGDLVRDTLARNFAFIALGEIGGEEVRSNLIARLAQPGGRFKPWIALALGVLAAERASLGEDSGIGQALTEALEKMKHPGWRSAIAVALGLARHQEAGPKILDLVNKGRPSEGTGYCAVGLGLMGYRGAIDDLLSLLAHTTHQPFIRQQVPLGLGLMGDPSVAPDLVAVLVETPVVETPVSNFRAIVRELYAPNVPAFAVLGLGLLAAQGSIEPLVEILQGKDRFNTRQRALAAASLGRICDQAWLPWNSRIGVGLNYGTFGKTLVGEGIGLLDLF